MSVGDHYAPYPSQLDDHTVSRVAELSRHCAVCATVAVVSVVGGNSRQHCQTLGQKPQQPQQQPHPHRISGQRTSTNKSYHIQYTTHIRALPPVLGITTQQHEHPAAAAGGASTQHIEQGPASRIPRHTQYATPPTARTPHNHSHQLPLHCATTADCSLQCTSCGRSSSSGSNQHATGGSKQSRAERMNRCTARAVASSCPRLLIIDCYSVVPTTRCLPVSSMLARPPSSFVVPLSRVRVGGVSRAGVSSLPSSEWSHASSYSRLHSSSWAEAVSPSAAH